MHVVWFKRDLRVRDHAPLAEACRVAAAQREPVLCLYVHEPELLASPEMDASHVVFIDECLAILDERLRERGSHLVIRHGAMPEILAELHRARPIRTLWSHRETGNRITYDRDLRVGAWCREQGVPWEERSQNGVIRRLGSRDGWAGRWQARMRQPLVPAPPSVPGPPPFPEARRPLLRDLGLPPSTKADVQIGGEEAAWDTLDSFLDQRGMGYRQDMSTPLEGWESCSRVSPHLAWGSLSIRQVFQRTEQRVRRLRRDPKADPRWLKSMTSFHARLRWHCHFMQKLEDEPSLEFENMNRAYDGLRPDTVDPPLFEAWKRGETGYPIVDACMRALLQTGWINFRMRAMLVSFACHHLWQPWRPVALHLGRHFLDFEPGIHFSQVQMQAGTTGMNTVRIYSPIKQAQDQDPDGIFIRRFVPELAPLPTPHVLDPAATPPLVQQAHGCLIGRDYPEPIVDHGKAYAAAKKRLFAHKRRPEVRAEAARVFERHGSRRRPRARPRR